MNFKSLLTSCTLVLIGVGATDVTFAASKIDGKWKLVALNFASAELLSNRSTQLQVNQT